MQIFPFPIVYFCEGEVTDMSVTETRVQKIEEKINNLRDKIDNLVGLPGQIKGIWFVVPILFTIILGGGGYLFKEVSDQGKNSATTIEALVTIKQDLADVKHDIKQLMMTQRLSQIAVDPKNPSNIKEATNILSNAKQGEIRIDPDIIRETGNKFITTATVQPESWQAVKGYLNYKSFLNASLTPSTDKLKPFGKLLNTTVSRNLYINGFGITDYEKSARFEILGKSRQASSAGPEFIVITGDSDSEVTLDNQYIKNAVIKNLHIVYHGGLTHLENVYFVNCTFDFQIGPKGQQLGRSILASTSVTFESST